MTWSISRLFHWTPRSLIAAALLVLAAQSAQAADLQPVWEHRTGLDLAMAAQADAQGRPFVYVALKSGGVAVLQTRGDRVRRVARISRGRLGNLDATNLYQRGRLLFVSLGGHFKARGHAGLAILDVSRPARPKILRKWRSAKSLKGAAHVVANGTHAWLAVMRHGVIVFRHDSGTRLARVGSFLPDMNFPHRNPSGTQIPNARGLFLRGKRLFVAFDAGGLRIFNVANPSAPREIGRYANSRMGRKPQAFNNVVVHGKTAYVAVDYCGLEILDISRPRAIRRIGWWNPWRCHTNHNIWFNSPGHTNQIAYDPRRREVLMSAGDSELQVVSVANPRQPRLVAQHGGPKNGAGVWGLSVAGDLVLLSYIRTALPFRGTWSGVKAVRR